MKIEQKNNNTKGGGILPQNSMEFQWTDELICEFARKIAIEYKKSNLWSGDFGVEKAIMESFKKEKMINFLLDGLLVKDLGEEAIVNSTKLNDLINYLYKKI